MKFVCRTCEAFMLFEEVEPIREGSLGVTFSCPKCGSRIAMVTNPGETQLVHALGVKLGGRGGGPAPLELTRETLKASASQGGVGSCPFSEVVGRMGDGAEGAPAAGVEWTPEAQARLERIPETARPFARAAIEQLARDRGLGRVDERLMDEARDQLMR